jgi:hypothetical protein
MRFSPKTDNEIAAANLLPNGDYSYEVMSAEEATSRAGNEMLKLKLRIFVGESERHVYDYLLEAMAGKLKHFCDSHGLTEKYQRGALTARDCEGLSGECSIGLKHDKSGQYPDQNTVLDYIIHADCKPIIRAHDLPATAQPLSRPSTFVADDDSIPF